MTQRTTEGTINWYQANEVWPGEIGFDPDGMCQKICRVARNIGSGFGSAIAQQHGTPQSLRVHDISKITRGMVVFYDDTRDSNPFGHIATVVGRVKGVDRDSLGSLLVRTNAVQSNRISVVRGDYFGPHWGDFYQFAGKSLNGVTLDLPDGKPKPEPEPKFLPKEGLDRLRRMLDIYDEMIDNHRGEDRIVTALRRDKRTIRQTIRRLSG